MAGVGWKTSVRAGRKIIAHFCLTLKTMHLHRVEETEKVVALLLASDPPLDQGRACVYVLHYNFKINYLSVFCLLSLMHWRCWFLKSPVGRPLRVRRVGLGEVVHGHVATQGLAISCAKLVWAVTSDYP